jgi:simple sugar transport system permease protein
MTTTLTKEADERLAGKGLARRLLMRPELGALIGAVAVFVFFALRTDAFATASGIASFLDPSSTLGIVAVAVALLMIGGEFDLSAGVMTGSAALIVALLVGHWGWNLWAAIAVAVGLGLAVGLANGLLVISTGLPSFIVTLGTFLALQGLNLGVSKEITGTVSVSIDKNAGGYDSAHYAFASTFTMFGTDFQASVLWWIVIALVGSWVLLRTRAGNWIFGVGGDVTAARGVGVPAARTKVVLFVTVSLAATLAGVITSLRFTTVQANQGVGLEFQYIIAAVIGGCLLTGGYGSVIGAAIGALIFGMARVGLSYANIDDDWFNLFLGVLLLLATLLNYFVRGRAEAAR